MDDEELRAQFAHLLTPQARIRVPAMAEITRRMRRRQLRQATAGVLACAVVVAAAGLVRSAASPPASGHGPAAPRCAQSALRVSWKHVRGPSGTFINSPPSTSLVVVRNTSRSACAIKGWPRLTMTARHPVKSQTTYGTINSMLLAHHKRNTIRWTLPTWVTLRPGRAATAAVTVFVPPLIQGCDSPRWSVRLPVTGARALQVRHGPVYVCKYSQIEVSPFYPAGVPLTRNYPYPQLAAFPAEPIYSTPPATAGPGAAPYFVAVGTAKSPAPVIVRNWRTGEVTATIRPPAGSGPDGFVGVAATSDDSDFILATTIGSGAGAATGHLRFYQLQLHFGSPLVPISPLPVPPAAELGTRFAVSADGTELALALRTRSGATKILTVGLVLGQLRSWTTRIPGSVTALTWAGSHQLAFTWSAAKGAGLRVLDTAKPGRDLLAAPLLIPSSVRFAGLHGLLNPLISSDGTTVFVTMTSRAGANPQAAVVKFAASTGQPEAVLTPRAGESGIGTWCGALWSDPAGSTATAVCGVQGIIHNAGFAKRDLHFPAPNFSAGPDQFAW